MRRPAVAPAAPVAGPSAAVPVHVCDEHDDDSEKENKPYKIEGAEVEEEEEEGDFEWKCRLLDIIQQYPVHGPFKSICRSGANPEKTLRIRGGDMQVYHHNQ